jgi:hypothetical protein
MFTIAKREFETADFNAEHVYEVSAIYKMTCSYEL